MEDMNDSTVHILHFFHSTREKQSAQDPERYRAHVLNAIQTCGGGRCTSKMPKKGATR